MFNRNSAPHLLKYATLFVCLIVVHNASAGSWQRGQPLGGFAAVDVYTPDRDSPTGPAGIKSLLIVLHGCVQPISSFQNANLEDAAEAYGMVIAVPDAVHKAGFSCWAYWTGAPSRSNNDYENLIELAQDMTADPGRSIDSNQVYIAGLSSGATFAHTTACLAPDIFAGVGVSAGPSIGTSSNGALGGCEQANVASRCANYAGSYASFFATQISSIAQADDDATVDKCYNAQNSDGMAQLYGVQVVPGSNIITEGSNTATETLWQDGRVSKLWFNGGVRHAWSGGAGASGAYISPASINYATYLGNYFSTYNRRVNRNQPPLVEELILTTAGSVINISAAVSDSDGEVVSADATVTDLATNEMVDAVSLSGVVASESTFTGDTLPLSDGLYRVATVARDEGNAASPVVANNIRVGNEPEPSAPQLSDIGVLVDGNCATVAGTVVDVNRDLNSVQATFSIGDVEASITDTRYSAEACDLPPGVNNVTVTATDLSGLTSTDGIAFAIDDGQTATISEHISAGRLDYPNYADCYLEYGFDAFTLTQVIIDAESANCRWQDDDASCIGPQRSCSATQ